MQQSLTKPYPITAYLIDPIERRIAPVTLTGRPDPLSEIYTLLGCRCFTAAHLTDTDAVYVDDEGMTNGPVDQLFGIKGVYGALAGRGLVVGVDQDGNDASPSLTLLQIQFRLFFLQRVASDKWAMTPVVSPHKSRVLPLDKIVIELAGRA